MSDYQANNCDELPLFATKAPADDGPRLNQQCREILARLRRGQATNRELAGYALKYTSRISDLREAGFDIRNERLRRGLTLYTLHE